MTGVKKPSAAQGYALVPWGTFSTLQHHTIHGALHPAVKDLGQKFPHFYPHPSRYISPKRNDTEIKTKQSRPGERVLDSVFCFCARQSASCWWSVGAVRLRSVCRLASQTQLLTVCSTPPTPTLPALSNVSPCAVCENTEIKVVSAALDDSSAQSWNQDLMGAWTGPAVWAADRLDPQLGVRSQTDGSDTWVRRAGRRPTHSLLERHWPPQPGNLPSSQACSFTSDENCYQGRTRVFLTVRNPAMTVSIRGTGVRDASFGSAARLLGDLGQAASPLQASAVSSALLLVV